MVCCCISAMAWTSRCDQGSLSCRRKPSTFSRCWPTKSVESSRPLCSETSLSGFHERSSVSSFVQNSIWGGTACSLQRQQYLSQCSLAAYCLARHCHCSHAAVRQLHGAVCNRRAWAAYHSSNIYDSSTSRASEHNITPVGLEVQLLQLRYPLEPWHTDQATPIQDQGCEARRRSEGWQRVLQRVAAVAQAERAQPLQPTEELQVCRCRAGLIDRQFLQC